MDSKKYLTGHHQMQLYEVTLLLLFVVIFIPSFASLRNSEESINLIISSLMWRTIFYRDGTIVLRPDLHLFTLQYFGLKYLFIYQFYRYYRRLTTKRRVFLVGILSEMQLFIVLDGLNIIQIMQGMYTWTAFTWYIPIPIALVIACILMILVRQPESEPMWIDKEEGLW